MIKNTASQKIGAQMVSATDGSAFTSAVTVSVTGDAGTQATGSVGSGACTHEGNGYHTYAPAQAETNYDLIAFTFTGTGAIPVTVQVYTIAGDAFTRLGAPAGASVSADVAAVKVDTAAILVDTGTTLDGRIPAALVSGRMDSSVGAMAANVITAAATAADFSTEVNAAPLAILGTPAGASMSADIAAIEAQTDDIGTAGAGLTAVPWNAAWDAEVQSEVDDALVVHRLDELLNADSDIDGAAPPTVGSVFHEVMTKTAGSFTYDQTTDSLEATRDNMGTAQTGDAYAIVNSGTHGNAALKTLIDAVDDFLDTEIAAILAAVDTEVAAIKAKTDGLTFTVATVLDANVQRVNDVALVGDGSGTPWGP